MSAEAILAEHPDSFEAPLPQILQARVKSESDDEGSTDIQSRP